MPKSRKSFGALGSVDREITGWRCCEGAEWAKNHVCQIFKPMNAFTKRYILNPKPYPRHPLKSISPKPQSLIPSTLGPKP